MHSLSGIIRIGAFLVEHFFENRYAQVSPEKFNYVAAKLETIPWRVPVEFLLIWLPIAFHGGYGCYHMVEEQAQFLWPSVAGELDVHAAALDGDHSLCLYHLARMDRAVHDPWKINLRRRCTRIRESVLPRILPHRRADGFLSSWQRYFPVLNKWGIAVTPRAQRKAGWLGLLVGLAFTVVGLSIVAGFVFDWHPFNGYL